MSLEMPEELKIDAAGQVSFGDSTGPEVKENNSGGEDSGRDLGGTDCNFAKFETGGGKVRLADINA